MRASCHYFHSIMSSVELIVFVACSVLHAGVYSSGLHCSNDTKCRCHILNEDIVANCSGQNLSEFPKFDDKVTVIDASLNKFTFFPQSLPTNIRYLDLSGNKIKRFTKSNCCRSLETLKLDHNHLGNGSVLMKLFNKLISLEFLSMKGNIDEHSLKNIEYPKGLFVALRKLVSLHIDGYSSANIGDLFATDNDLKYLDMSGSKTCELLFIRKEMFAQKFSQIRNLSLSYCHIMGIEKGAFESLQSLLHLDISNNQELSLDAIPNITYNIHRGIETLNFAKLQCTFGTTKVLKREHVMYLCNTTLKSLNLAGNRLAYADKGVTKLLPITLKHINGGENFLSFGIYVFELSFLKGLETLNISHQSKSHQAARDFFSNCHDEQHTPKMPSFREELSCQEEHGENELKVPWIFDWKERNFNFTFSLPPNLKVVYMQQSSYTISLNVLIFVRNQITHLFFSNNLFIKILYPLLGLQNLTYIDLSQNLLTNISGIRKNDCGNLKFLNLSFNMLGNSFEYKTNGEIFQHLHSLEVLDLSTNRLTGLAGGVFDFLRNIRHLNISFNKLDEWNVEMGQMKHLVSLDLSNNGISVLSKSTMDALDFSASLNTVSVNLFGNPLMCTCDNIQFLHWLNQPASSGLHFPHKEHYKCVFSNSSSAKMGNISMLIHQMSIECTYYPFITLGCVFFVFVFLGITTWKILHRYRWTLRYWYYVSRSTPKRYKSMENFHYRYDAFISYDEEDSEIALQLIKSLETKKQMNCCIPERDFMPGTNIADNIINAIHVSKKFVCILSGSYLDSNWSMFEFHMGQLDAIHSRYREDRNIFIVVLLKDTLKVEYLKPAILNLLKSDSCVTYSDSRDAQYVCVEELSDLIGCENRHA